MANNKAWQDMSRGWRKGATYGRGEYGTPGLI